jgi:predicted ATP-grasp superfamily ATP-dependent carboligase
VLVGLDTMQGLQAARIFARRGVPVVAVASNPAHYACKTNVCERIIFADCRSEEVITVLEREAAKFAVKPVLVACDDPQVDVVSRFRGRLEPGYHLPLPSAGVIDLMLDKVAFYSYAESAGLPIPRTVFLRTREDATRAAGQLAFPIAVKPPYKGGRWSQHTTLKAFKLHSPDELLPFYDEHHAWADVLIAQEWVEGPDSELYSCNAYFDATSTPLVTFVARKIRQWPPRVGDSSLGVECRNDLVEEVTVKLFGGAGYHGLAYLEMKRDTRTGEYLIMEPNVGRPTGRSAIAEAGGVELLYTLYCDTVGLPLPAGRTQTFTGVKWINLRKDTQSALHDLRRKQLTLGQWRASVRGPKAYAVWSARDPRPFFSDLATSAGRLLGRGRRSRDARVL